MNEKEVSGYIINAKWTFHLLSGVLLSDCFSLYRSSYETYHSPPTKPAWFSLLLCLRSCFKVHVRALLFSSLLKSNSTNSNLTWVLNKFYHRQVGLISFQVHENGLISFGSTLNDQSPASFPLTNEAFAAAPYWADVYTERGGRVWYRKSTDEVIVSRATRDVIRAFPRYAGFVASWVVIVTWNEVTFYGASGVYTQKVS